MKRFTQNQIPAQESGESRIRRLSLNKPAKRNQAIAGAVIFVVIILHFALQFILFPGEKFQSEITSVKTEAEESAEIETRDAARNFDIETTPVSVPPIVQPKPKIAVSPRAVIKKKEVPRESRAERLRRAEKILTGA